MAPDDASEEEEGDKKEKKMPIHEYVCRKCHYEFEKLSKSNSDDTDIKCPNCCALNPERQISVFFSNSNKIGCSIDCPTWE